MLKRDRKTPTGDKRLNISNVSLVSILVALLLLAVTDIPPVNAGEAKIFSNSNKNTVHNLETPTFRLTKPMIITRIDTYHWNDQKGSPPGKIGIRGVGAWQAKGWPGMRNTPNANWTVYPNIRLEPGNYAITDSDPATWSQNSGSGGLGFAEVFGKSIDGSLSSPSKSGSLPGPSDKTADNWFNGFVSGISYSGNAFQGNKSWPFTIRVKRYNKATGSFVGELSWKTLGSVHLIRGSINGSQLNFKEVEAIKAGGAHLNVVYNARISNNQAKGTWVDQGDKSKGNLVIQGS